MQEFLFNVNCPFNWENIAKWLSFYILDTMPIVQKIC